MMTDTTDIEKKSLEAHVELCAQRYKALDERMAVVNEKIVNLSYTVDEVHQLIHKMAEKQSSVVTDVHLMVHKMTEKRNDQLIAWGVAVIGTLLAVIAYLITKHGI